MAQIRETIEALCAVLNNECPTKISAESFRLAKFNKVEATDTFWYTIYALLATKSVDQTDKTKHDVVNFCKHKMFYNGYRVTDFFELPDDMSCGSRELVLALGWLIAKENLVEKFINKVQPVVVEDPPVDISLLQRIPLPTVIGSYKAVAGQDTAEFGNHLVLCYGKLYSSLKSLLAARSEYTNLISKMHSIPKPSKSQNSTSHLSPLDVYLLRYPNEMTEYQKKLESFCSLVKYFLCWCDNELVFWTWMESVLDGKINDAEKDVEDDVQKRESNQQGQVYLKPSVVLQNAKEQQVELSKRFNSQEQLYRNVSRTWKKMRSSMESSEEVREKLGDVLSWLDDQLLSEITELQKALVTSQGLLRRNKHGLTGCLKKLSQGEERPAKSSREVVNHSKASEEIDVLLQEKKALEVKLRDLQEKHKTRLLHISQTQKNLVCIPPVLRGKVVDT